MTTNEARFLDALLFIACDCDVPGRKQWTPAEANAYSAIMGVYHSLDNARAELKQHKEADCE